MFLLKLLKKATYKELVDLFLHEESLYRSRGHIKLEAMKRHQYNTDDFYVPVSIPHSKRSYQELLLLFNSSKRSPSRRNRAKKEAMKRVEYKEEDFPHHRKYTFSQYKYKELIELYGSEKDRFVRFTIKKEAKTRESYYSPKHFNSGKYVSKEYSELVVIFKEALDGQVRGVVKRTASMFRSEYKEEDFPRLRQISDIINPLKATAFNLWYYKKMTLEDIGKSSIFHKPLSRERIRQYVTDYLTYTTTKYYSEWLLVKTCWWCGVEQTEVQSRIRLLTGLKRGRVKHEKFFCSLCSSAALRKCGECKALFYLENTEVNRQVCNPCNALRQRNYLKKNPEYLKDPVKIKKTRKYMAVYQKTHLKKLRKERILQGLCILCGNPVEERHKYSYCKKCRDININKSKMFTKKRREKGLCTKCGRARDKDGTFLVCLSCRRKGRRKKLV